MTTPTTRAELVELMISAIDRMFHDDGRSDAEICNGILDAMEAADVRLVPVKPTEDMVVVGDGGALEVLNDHTFALRSETLASRVYAAMVVTSPYRKRVKVRL